MNGVIADQRRPLHLDTWIEGIVRIEIKKAEVNRQGAEGQSGFKTFQPHLTLELRMQTGPADLHVYNGVAAREIAANQKRLLALDREIEFPIAQRRVGKRNVRMIRHRLGVRRGSSRQSDRNDFDILEKTAVGRPDPAAYGRAVERTRDFHVGIDTRGEVIVP